jgi:plastocyanin
MTLVHRSWRLAVVLGLMLVAVLAVPAVAKSVGVSIEDKAYNPATIEVEVGDTVTWTVTKSIGEPHSVTAGKPGETGSPPVFDSGIDVLKDNGSTFSQKFDAPGTFDYYCTVHADVMHGVVEVIEVSEGPIPAERKLIAGGILVATLIVLFVANFFWRRMNPA